MLSLIFMFVYLIVTLTVLIKIVNKVYSKKPSSYRYWVYRSFSALVFFSSYMLSNYITLQYTMTDAINNTITILIGLIIIDYFFNIIERFGSAKK